MTSEVSYPVILQSMVKHTRMSKGRGRLISPAGGGVDVFWNDPIFVHGNVIRSFENSHKNI